MYYINPTIKVSSPTLINILKANDFTITISEKYITITDKIRGSKASCSFEYIINYLEQTSLIYNKYKEVPKELLEAKEKTPIFVNIEKEYKELVNKLIYFTGIQKCAKNLGRLQKILELKRIKEKHLS